jgi:membrane-associated phospholipid phosphatase
MSDAVSKPTFELRLPGIASRREKYLLGLACLAITGALYLLPNRFQWTAPARLPLTMLDEAIPFVPGTGWIYAAVYGVLIWAFVGLRDLAQVSRFLYAGLAVQIVAASVFVVYPTAFPRELFPPPPDTHALNVALVGFFRTLDQPTNCLPSLHVTTTLLCLAAFDVEGRRHLLPAVAVAAVLLWASTMTFKQHYALDVLAGLALGWLAYFLFFRWRGFQVEPR